MQTLKRLRRNGNEAQRLDKAFDACGAVVCNALRLFSIPGGYSKNFAEWSAGKLADSCLQFATGCFWRMSNWVRGRLYILVLSLERGELRLQDDALFRA